MATPSVWGKFLAAIRAQESGGNYSQDSAGCLGAYCWSTQAGWDTMAQAAGQAKYVGVNPSQVPPAVQDTVASTNLGRIYQQTHSLGAAARWWNGGSTQSEPNPGLPAQSWAPSCGGGSSAAYACQILRRMALGGHYLAGGGSGATTQGGSGAGGTVTLTAAQQADCAIGTGNLNPLPSWLPGVGGQISVCFVTKSNVRSWLAIGNIVGGTVVFVIGLGFVFAFTRAGRQVINLVSVFVPGVPKTPPSSPSPATQAGGGKKPPTAAQAQAQQATQQGAQAPSRALAQAGP